MYGYQESSLRDISSSIGVTHAGLRYHFEAKEELLIAVLQKYTREYDEIFSVEILAAESEAKSPWGAVEAFVHSIQFELDNPGFVRLFNSQALLSSQPGNLTFDFFANRLDEVRESYTRFLEMLQVQNILKPQHDVPRAAAILLATIDGLYLQHLIQPEKGEIIDNLHTFLRAIVRPEQHERLAETFGITAPAGSSILS